MEHVTSGAAAQRSHREAVNKIAKLRLKFKNNLISIDNLFLTPSVIIFKEIQIHGIIIKL